MQRSTRRFLYRLAILVPILLGIWVLFGSTAYRSLLSVVAESSYRAVGLADDAFERSLAFVLKRSPEGVVALFALVLASTGVTVRRRLLACLLGFTAVLAWHLVLPLILRHVMFVHQLDQSTFVMLIPVLLLTDALPFVFWICTTAQSPATACTKGTPQDRLA